jgi:hypothetical protein
METVTITASRGFTVSDVEMLVGSAVTIAALAWIVLTRMRQLHSRHHEPRT